MIFLDANAFYSYYGRKKLGLIESSYVNEKKLSCFLDSVKDKSLPTSVFIEVMVHFRDDSKKLRKMLDFIKEKGMPLYNNIPDYCISDDEITYVHYMDEIALGKYVYKLLDEKIGIESRFSYLFYEITRNLYLEYRLSEIGIFSEDEEKGIWNLLGKKDLYDNKESLIKEFELSLRGGYLYGKDQNVLKAKYIEKLNEACQIIDVTLAACAACIEKEVDIVDRIEKAYNESIAKGFDGINGTMPGIVTLLKTNTVFLEEAKTKISNMFQKHNYNRYQTEYLRTIMFTAWFDRAQKLKKNDIFDMMCAGCFIYLRPIQSGESVLVNTETYIISFDSTMEKFIESVKPTNTVVIEEYKN